LIVQLAVVMEDERMMHPLLRVEPVDIAPLDDLVAQTPGLQLVLLNALGKLRGQPLHDLIAAGEVYVEIAMLEGVGGVGNLLAQVRWSACFLVPTRRCFISSRTAEVERVAADSRTTASDSRGNALRLLPLSRR